MMNLLQELAPFLFCILCVLVQSAGLSRLDVFNTDQSGCENLLMARVNKQPPIALVEEDSFGAALGDHHIQMDSKQIFFTEDTLEGGATAIWTVPENDVVRRFM